MSAPSNEREKSSAAVDVPEIIRAGGEKAVAMYGEFIDDPNRRPITNENYSGHARRFFRWCEGRGLTLQTIDADIIAGYVVELRTKKSEQVATTYLTPVRGLFRHLAQVGVLFQNPFEPVPAENQKRSRSPSRALILVGFPLLDLLAMLGDMEEETLGQVFNDEELAISLLRQVRWPNGRVCPHCGASVADDSVDQTVCRECAKAFDVTTGMMFEQSNVPLRAWFAVIHHLYLADTGLPDEELQRRFGLDLSAMLSLRRQIGMAMERDRLPIGDELKQTITVRNRELVQDQVVRAIIYYAELEAVRDRLLRARDEATSVDDLPEGMSLEEAIESIGSRIAEEDGYVYTVDDGYLVRYLASPKEVADA